MASKQEVENFLRDFKAKMRIMNVVFRSDRDSNIQALADLDIRPIEREATLKNLKVTDYSEGPLEEKLHGGSDMWIFGVDIKGKETYIKISMGLQDNPVICISFHPAKHKMTYPLKN